MALIFKTCPVCGKEPVILSEQISGEDKAYIARCPDSDCVLWNDDTFDDIFACCESWNAKVEENTPKADEESGEDMEGTGETEDGNG